MSSFPRSILSPQPRRTAHSIEVLEQRIAPATIVVTNTLDSGAGSLRQAIIDANVTTAADDIEFSIDAGSAPWIIQPGSPLPAIVAPVSIDGYTQIGEGVNTLSEGTNAFISIVLDGSLAGVADGLRITDAASAGSTISGLAIVGFQNAGIVLDNPSSSILGNFIGVDPNRTTDHGNGGAGISVLSGTGHQIGAEKNVADRNLISGNGSHGISLAAGGASGGVLAFTRFPLRVAIETLRALEERGAGAKIGRARVLAILAEEVGS